MRVAEFTNSVGAGIRLRCAMRGMAFDWLLGGRPEAHHLALGRGEAQNAESPPTWVLSMVDRVFLDALRLKCRVGVTDEERREPQEVVLDISMEADLKRAGTTDDLRDTVDYREAVRDVSELVSGKQFKLLENLAEGIAARMLERDGVEGVTVRARKARYSGEPSIGIEIRRERGHG